MAVSHNLYHSRLWVLYDSLAFSRELNETSVMAIASINIHIYCVHRNINLFLSFQINKVN